MRAPDTIAAASATGALLAAAFGASWVAVVSLVLSCLAATFVAERRSVRRRRSAARRRERPGVPTGPRPFPRHHVRLVDEEAS